MTTEVQSLQLNVQVATKIVNQLALLDGRGYELMGHYSQIFLSDLASEGKLTYENLSEYFDTFQAAYQEVTWINSAVQEKTRNWLNTVAFYLHGINNEKPSVESAQSILSF